MGGMKTEIKNEIKLNYDPKLQIDDTCILTQDCDQNDPINRWIQGFSFRNFENDHRCSRDEFSIIDRRDLSFNHSVDTKMCIEEIRSKRFKDGRV